MWPAAITISATSVNSITIQFDARTQTAFIPVTLQLGPGRLRVTRDEQDRDFNLGLESLIARGLRAELNTQSFVTGQSEMNLDFRPDVVRGFVILASPS